MIHGHGACWRQRDARNRVCSLMLLAVGFVTLLALFLVPATESHAASLANKSIVQRHADISRGLASGAPKKEADQKVINGWPMYRTNRGQDAFNAAMATLAVTDVQAPPAFAFKGCKKLHCHLLLPKIGKDGWIPSGRIWVAPDEYVLVVHSRRPQRYRRRSRKSMRYFIFHEFHNSTRNTDVFDTISAHKRSVFVPFYLGKEGKDARGQKYVVIVQVAPYDVVSRHATTHGSRGPGVEVAKNKWEKLSTVQSKAGIVLASIVEQKAPYLRMVHHRHQEGLPMLRAYKARIAALKGTRGARKVRLPFSPATRERVRKARVALGALIARKGVKRIARPIIGQRRVNYASGKRPKAIRTSRKPRKVIAKLPTPKRAYAKRAATKQAAAAVPAPKLVANGRSSAGFGAPTAASEAPKVDTSLTMQSLIESIFNEASN